MQHLYSKTCNLVANNTLIQFTSNTYSTQHLGSKNQETEERQIQWSKKKEREGTCRVADSASVGGPAGAAVQIRRGHLEAPGAASFRRLACQRRRSGWDAVGTAAQLLRGEGRRRRHGSTSGTDDAVGRIGCGGELWTGRGGGSRGKSARFSGTRLRCRVEGKRSSCEFCTSQISGIPGKRKLS